MANCPKCPCCQGKAYQDPKTGKEKINICHNCRRGVNHHKKMAKPRHEKT